MRSITDYKSQVRSTTDYKSHCLYLSPKQKLSLTTNPPKEKHSIVDLLFIVAPIVCVGSVFFPWFVIQYFMSF